MAKDDQNGILVLIGTEREVASGEGIFPLFGPQTSKK